MLQSMSSKTCRKAKYTVQYIPFELLVLRECLHNMSRQNPTGREFLFGIQLCYFANGKQAKFKIPLIIIFLKISQ